MGRALLWQAWLNAGMLVNLLAPVQADNYAPLDRDREEIERVDMNTLDSFDYAMRMQRKGSTEWTLWDTALKYEELSLVQTSRARGHRDETPRRRTRPSNKRAVEVSRSPSRKKTKSQSAPLHIARWRQANYEEERKARE